MGYREMSEKQLLAYGVRVRLTWFRNAEQLVINCIILEFKIMC